MNGYELSRNWFDWAFENPSKINPTHGILYFFCIEHCNRLGWKKEFGLPTTMAKEAIGVRSYNTYIKALNDLVKWGFIKMVEKSKNQYSSNIIALSKFDKAPNKALDKALIKHATKQSESIVQSIDSIDKQETINNEPINNKQDGARVLDPFINHSQFELAINDYRKKDFTTSAKKLWCALSDNLRNEFCEWMPKFIELKKDTEDRYLPSLKSIIEDRRFLDPIVLPETEDQKLERLFKNR